MECMYRFIKGIWSNFRYRREGNMQDTSFDDIVSWFEVNSYCSILHVPLCFYPKHHFTASIDRKVTKLPYNLQNNPENIQSVCCFINIFLKTWSKSDEDEIVKEWRQFTYPQYRATRQFKKLIQNLQMTHVYTRNEECLMYLKRIAGHIPTIVMRHDGITKSILNEQ